jgi:hypothetical protein
VYGGAVYGGAVYGGARYGGARYANYDFQPSYDYAAPPAPYASDYVATTVADPGAIVGRVVRARGREPRPQVPTAARGCGDSTDDAKDTGDGADQAVVYLEGIRRGRGYLDQGQSRRLQIGGVIVRRDCGFEPRVQVVAPIGATLSITSRDAGPHALRILRFDDPSATRVAAASSIELRGSGETREFLLDASGFYAVGNPADDPAAGAWAVVAAHPYYTFSDEDGEFRLDDVPPGTYSLVVWHPGVYAGQGRWTEPTIVRRQVTVKPHHATSMTIPLR